MKKDTIQKRNRKEQGTSSSAKARRKQRELMEQEEREREKGRDIGVFFFVVKSKGPEARLLPEDFTLLRAGSRACGEVLRELRRAA